MSTRPSWTNRAHSSASKPHLKTTEFVSRNIRRLHLTCLWSRTSLPMTPMEVRRCWRLRPRHTRPAGTGRHQLEFKSQPRHQCQHLRAGGIALLIVKLQRYHLCERWHGLYLLVEHGGWGFYTARQYTASPVTYLFGAEQTDNGATWKAAQDTALTGTNGATEGQNLRIRFSIQNTGPYISGMQYLLQFAPLAPYLNCESVPGTSYNAEDSELLRYEGSVSATSAQFTNNTPTSPSLSFPSSMQFAPGWMIQDPGDGSFAETASSSLPNNVATKSSTTSSSIAMRLLMRIAYEQTDSSMVSELTPTATPTSPKRSSSIRLPLGPSHSMAGRTLSWSRERRRLSALQAQSLIRTDMLT